MWIPVIYYFYFIYSIYFFKISRYRNIPFFGEEGIKPSGTKRSRSSGILLRYSESPSRPSGKDSPKNFVVEIPKQVDNRIKEKGRKSIFERIYHIDEPCRVGKSVSPPPKKLRSVVIVPDKKVSASESKPTLIPISPASSPCQEPNFIPISPASSSPHQVDDLSELYLPISPLSEKLEEVSEPDSSNDPWSFFQLDSLSNISDN